MFYRLRHTFVAVPLDDEAVLFRSDTRSFKVEGTFAALLSRQLLPHLTGRVALDDVARSVALPSAQLKEHLDALVSAGVLESSAREFQDIAIDPRLNLPQALATDPSEVARRLSTASIVIFGLDGVGEIVAEQIAMLGFERLRLADPAGAERERRTVERLQSRYPLVRFMTSPSGALDRARVLDLSRGADLLIACCDKEYEAGNHWVNRACVELNIPALFCRLGGVQAFGGPFVVPGMTACYMCAKMRSVATSESFEEAMACERFFDQRKQSGFTHREFFASSLSILAGLLATDAYKYVVLQYQPALLGQIIEFDPMGVTLERHTVLEQPQCPVCSKKKTSHVIIPAWRNSTAGPAPPDPSPR
jgi:bacteriocin biosynthesis cyclodehydratase domain-containing protein